MRASRFSVVRQLSAYVGVLAVLMTAQGGRAQLASSGYEPPWYHDGNAHYEKKEQVFGKFNVVRNIQDYREIPMLDSGPWITKEAIFSWHDSTDTIGFAFVDNGASVRFTAHGKSADGQTICLMQGVLVGYDPKPSALENWQKLQPFIRQQIRGCTAIAPADLGRATAEMQMSSADYVMAANVWKGVSVELFGSNARRCVAERMMKPFTMPPRYECSTYSKP